MKDKIIEEMANIIIQASCYGSECETCSWVESVKGATECCVCLKALYNAGYRKIPEGAVVLTRADYEKLLDVRADVILKDIDKVFKEEFEDTKRSMEKK